MARPRLAWLLTVLLLPLIARADEKPCTGRNAGKYYDLNGLQTANDYKFKTPEGHDMVLTACKSVSQETWHLEVEDPGQVGGFVRRDHGDFSLGQKNTTLSFSSRAPFHPHLTFTSGSKCVDANGNTLDHLRGSTEIEFVCDPAAGNGVPRLIAQLPPGGDAAACAWVFEWRTKAACPTSEGLTFGGVVWFLFISSLILLGLYLLVGTLYNYFMLGLAGTDALPRFSVSSAMYHGREAWESGREWWASGRGGGFNFSSTGSGGGARGPVGLGGPGGFRRPMPKPSHQTNTNTNVNPASHHTSTSTAQDPDPERGERSFGNGTTGSGANSFIRTSVRKEQPHPQPQAHPGAGGLNPASHQAQVMSSGGAAGVAREGLVPSAGAMSPPMSMPMPPPTSPGTGAAAAAAAGLNPASHQAQMMSGMPVPHLSRGNSNSQNAAAPAAVTPPTPGRGTFAVGDDEGEEDDGANEIQIADVRGRTGDEGEGVVKL